MGDKRRIGELVDHYHYSVAFGERWTDGYRHLSTSVSSSSSNSSKVRILSTTLHYTTLHLHTRGEGARQKSKVDLQKAAAARLRVYRFHQGLYYSTHFTTKASDRQGTGTGTSNVHMRI